MTKKGGILVSSLEAIGHRLKVKAVKKRAEFSLEKFIPRLALPQPNIIGKEMFFIFFT